MPNTEILFINFKKVKKRLKIKYMSLTVMLSHSPSNLVLGVEPDYLLYSKVPPHWTPVQNGGGNAARKIFASRGGLGGAAATFGSPPWRGVSGAAPPKLKTAVKLPCKSIVISSQSGPFIRQMI